MSLASCWQWLHVGSNKMKTIFPVLARSSLVKRMPLFRMKNVKLGIVAAGSLARGCCGCCWAVCAFVWASCAVWAAAPAVDRFAVVVDPPLLHDMASAAKRLQESARAFLCIVMRAKVRVYADSLRTRS